MLSPLFEKWFETWVYKPGNITNREKEIANAAFIAGAFSHLARSTPTDRLDTLDEALQLIEVVQDGHRVALDALREETAEWIGSLQDEDMRQSARLKVQEHEMVTCRRAFDTTAGECATLGAHLDALAERVEKLEKWVDGTDLAVSERICILTEQMVVLESVLDATNKRTSKQHYALECRFAEFGRLAGFRDKLIEKQHGMLSDQDVRIENLEKQTNNMSQTLREFLVQLTFFNEPAHIRERAKELLHQMPANPTPGAAFCSCRVFQPDPNFTTVVCENCGKPPPILS